MIPRAAIYAILLLLGSALWNLVPPLLLLVTGWKADSILMRGADFSSAWIKVAYLVFAAGFGTLLFRTRRPGKDNSEFLLAAGFSILFLYLGYNLLNFLAHLFMLKGQANRFEGAAWIFILTGVLFLALLLKAPRRGDWALAGTLVFLSLLVYFSVSSFPLLGGFSNMLLTMETGGWAFLHGDSPYGLHSFQGYQAQCCYLPGLWLAFLPAVALKMDPRFLETIYTLIFAFMVWRGMRPQDRHLGSWFLVLFLLNPWALLRHEGYLFAYLLSWGAFFLALRRGRPLAAACCFGWGLSAHPFSWALLPVWVAWNANRCGWKKAGMEFLQAIGVAALVILPFVFWDPQGFFQGAVLHWVGRDGIAVSHFGLAAWLAPWPGLLSALAVAFLGAGTWAAWRGTASLESLFKWSALSLGLALLASYHVEHYYYFVPFALVFFHEIVILGFADTEDRNSGSLQANLLEA